jgi:hypothetical protein
MTRHPATTRNRSHSAAHTGHRTGPRAGLRLRPLLRDLLSVGLATLFASGAAFSLGVLVPRVEQRTATPASHTPPPPPGEGVYTV